jgi:hypothetical protein
MTLTNCSDQERLQLIHDLLEDSDTFVFGEILDLVKGVCLKNYNQIESTHINIGFITCICLWSMEP